MVASPAAAIAAADLPAAYHPVPGYVAGVFPVNPCKGEYLVRSASDPAIFWACDVVRCTCECPAGARGFSTTTAHPWCKHLRAAKAVARLIHDAVATHRASVQWQRLEDHLVDDHARASLAGDLSL